MSKYANKSQSCPVEKTLSIIGKKWAVLIIRDLLTRTMRFGELLSSLEGISPRTLSARLVELEHDGIITRKALDKMPPHVEYSLTPRGRALHTILDDMSRWGSKR